MKTSTWSCTSAYVCLPKSLASVCGTGQEPQVMACLTELTFSKVLLPHLEMFLAQVLCSAVCYFKCLHSLEHCKYCVYMSEMIDILCIMFLHIAIEVLLFYFKTLLLYLEYEKNLPYKILFQLFAVLT